MASRLFRRALAAAFAILFAASICLAQEPQAKPAQATPEQGPLFTPQQKEYMAALDKLLAGQDYEGLGKALAKANDGPSLSAALGWGRARTLEGGGILMPLTYAALLWKAADMNPDYDFMRQTSDLMAFYGLLAAIADAPKCGDKSAPEHHLASIMQGYKRQFQHTAQLPAKQKQVVIDTAIALERRLASKRGDDKYLCRFGLQEHIDISNKYGDKAYDEVPAKPGQIGKQMALRNDMDYTPKFRAREQWEPKQEEARVGFPDLLSKILTTAEGK